MKMGWDACKQSKVCDCGQHGYLQNDSCFAAPTRFLTNTFSIIQSLG